MENNGEVAQDPFITINMAGPNQVQVRSNCPPGHFFKMMEAARLAMIDRFVKEEQGQGGLLIATPGMKIG